MDHHHRHHQPSGRREHRGRGRDPSSLSSSSQFDKLLVADAGILDQFASLPSTQGVASLVQRTDQVSRSVGVLCCCLFFFLHTVSVSLSVDRDRRETA